MRIWNLFTAALITTLLTSDAMSQATGQAQPAAAAKPNLTVVVVDMGHILDNHPTMKSEMEGIKALIAAADKEMAEKRDAIVNQMEQLREQFAEGTPEYDRAEKAIAEQDTAFRLELVKKRKEFETAQANVLYKVYNEMNGLLSFLSTTYGTQMVLRVSREKMDPKKPETIQMVMSQDVLYYNENIDLTGWVLKALQERAAQTASAGAASNR